MVQQYEPIRPAANEEVSCNRQSGIEAVFVEYGDALLTCYACDFTGVPDLKICRYHFNLLARLKDPFPALLDPFPSRDHVPSRMNAPRGFVMEPELVHNFDGAGFERAIETRIYLFDLIVGFIAHIGTSETTLAERRFQSNSSLSSGFCRDGIRRSSGKFREQSSDSFPLPSSSRR